ncbi:MAG: discoidin domain-containing protein [Chitinophagaceae bacterium]
MKNLHPKKLVVIFSKTILLVCLCFLHWAANAQMQVQGRFLYNKCGQKVTIRGIEHMLYYQDINQQMLPEIGKTGANAIRVLLDPAISGTTLRQILTKCINEQKMYVSVGVWSGQDFFFRSDIKAVLLEFEDNIILHGFGEPNYQTTPDDSRWKTESINVINRFRQAGYKAPIDIQTTTFGRDPNPIIRSGQVVFDADPLRNIIFGCQMYWGDWYTGLYGMTIAQGCQRFASLNYPVQIGACPSDCSDDCGRQAWDESFKNGLGCMWWSWTGDEFELSGNGNFNNLTADGQYVVNTSQYSISKTSVRSIPCTSGGDIIPPSVPTNLRSSAITQTSFTLTWNGSTDNTAVTGYEIFRNGTSLGTTTGTTFNVTNLSQGTNYSVTVRARDAVPNWSAQSGALSVRTASANLALNRPGFSSSNESTILIPSAAVDGNMSTRWSSLFSDPQWIYVDLGATYTINRVVLRWEVAYGRSYTIQTSSNASTWSTIFTTTTGNGATDDLAVSGTGRYIRMRGTVRGTTYGYSLWEFEVYGTAAAASAVNSSALKSITVEEIDETIPGENVFVSPNPTSSKNISVNIYSEKCEDVTLTLMTHSLQPVVSVRKTLAKGLNKISIPAHYAANGLYFISVRQGNKQVVKKVVIQN